MRTQKPELPSAPIKKVKYEVSIFDLIIMKSRLYARYSIKATGELAKTIYETEDKKILTKSKVGTDTVKNFYSSLIDCVYSDTCTNTPTIDDTARKITFYFDDGTSQKFEDLYVNGSINSDKLITDFFG